MHIVYRFFPFVSMHPHSPWQMTCSVNETLIVPSHTTLISWRRNFQSETDCVWILLQYFSFRISYTFA